MRSLQFPLLQRTRYNRTLAVRYALRHWNNPNPLFANLDTVGAGGDCSNFTSQCLLAGGWPQDYRRSAGDSEWWYRRIGNDPFDRDANDWWSCTWALAEGQFRYMQANHGRVEDLTRNPQRARTLRLGDILYYDWDGDGIVTHSSIVTARDRNGIPYVTYRTLAPLRPVRNRHWRLAFRGRAAQIYGMRLTDNPVVHPQQPDWNRLVPCDRTRA